MKFASRYILLLWIFISVNSVFATKRALIVAIGNYERTRTGWPSISSLNDIPLIDSILNQNNFSDKVILKDEQATRDGVLAALNKLAQRTQPGDVVLVHFSTHGQLIEDDNGGNAEEAIVAWGAPVEGDKGYKGEKHLLYRDILSMRDTLRIHAGPTGDVIFFFDACHSGGLTRGLAKTRGGAAPLKIAGWKTPAHTATRGIGGDGYWPPDNPASKDLAPYVAISACKSDELNSEFQGGHCGSLSYALLKSFEKIKTRDESYTQLYASLLNDMYDINPAQHPVISGNTDRGIFAGQAMPVNPHFVLKDKMNNGHYVLSGGAVNGLTKGSVLQAYRSGDKPKEGTAPLFTTSIVEEPGLLTSIVKLDTSIPNLKYTAYWLYIKEIAFNGQVIRLSLDSLLNYADIKKSITAYFKSDSEVELTSRNPNLSLGYNSQLKTYLIYSSLTGALMHTMPADNKLLKTYLLQYGQCTTLKKLSMSNEELSFSMNLRNAEGSDIQTKKGGIASVRDGDVVKISLSSAHEKPFYINIYDFRPDGTFELIKNDSKLTSSGITITARAGKPYGDDMLLAIASYEPLYLKSFESSSPDRLVASRGTLNSLQKIFRNPSARGLTAPGDEEGYTFSLTFEIEPR